MTLINFDIGLIAIFLVLVFHILGKIDKETGIVFFIFNVLLSLSTGVYYITSDEFGLSWAIGLVFIFMSIYSAFLIFYHGLNYTNQQ